MRETEREMYCPEELLFICGWRETERERGRERGRERDRERYELT